MASFSRPIQFRRQHVVLCLTLLCLAGCGEPSPEQRLASAKTSIEAMNLDRAAVELKAALQGRPNWAEARFLHGKVLLDLGDAAGAEAELRKAREMGHGIDEVVPSLARALLQLQRCKDSIAEFGSIQLATPPAIADQQTSLAGCHFALGDAAAMAKALQAADAAVPGYLPARVLQARGRAAQRRYGEALALLDNVLSDAPQQHEAWAMKGEFLLNSGGDNAAAIEALKRALAIKPDFLPAHAALVQLHLRKPDLEAAAAQIAILSQMRPGHPQTRYLQAQLAFERGDMKAARELTQQLLGRAPADPRLLLMAGTVELRAGRLRDAESHLRKALQAVPEARTVRLRLAQTYVRAGQAARAMETLAPLLATANGDPEVLTTLAEALLLTGELKKAEAAYRELTRLNPNDNKSRTALAVAQLSAGRFDAGVGELQRIAAGDSEATADLALVSAHMTRRSYAAALKAIEALARKQPKSPLPLHLRGVAELALKQVADARKSFEGALALDPGYVVSLQNLAALDLADKQPLRAAGRYENLLAVQPGNAQALLALAALRARAGGAPDDVAKLLAQAVKSSPAAVAPRLRLIELHLATKDLPAAAAAAQSGVEAVPTSAELWDVLGRVQSQQGELNQAKASFNKLKALLPASPVPLLRLADLAVAGQNLDGAASQLEAALRLKPDLLVAQRNLLALQIGSGKLAEAAKLAKTVQQQRPREAVGYLFEADVAMSRKELPAALAAYRQAMALQPSTPLAIKLHLALAKSAKSGEADAFAANWLKSHDKDLEFLVHLGRLAMASQSFEAAKQRFEQVLQQRPDHVVALNHLAQSMLELKLPGAEAHAAKANQLAPNEPGLMVTHAAALALDNQLPQAVVVQKKALEMQPGHHALRLDLARLYLRAGDKAQARAELRTLSALGPSYVAWREVEALLASL